VSLTNLGRAIAAGAVLSGVLLFQAVPVDAATNPTVIAVHQNGAVDVPGGSVLGRIASVSLPAGNWLITATATVIGTTYVNRLECQLIAGNEFYKSRTRPSGGGVASYQPIVLILAHHFAKAGTATLACYTDGWLGADLIRDVHVTAVQVGQLSDGGTQTGTGSPQAYYAQDTTLRAWTNNGYNLVQDLRLPPGTWLVQGVAWGASIPFEGDRIDCTLASSSSTADQSFGAFQDLGGERNVAVEGVLTLTSFDAVTVKCKDANGSWQVFGSAMSAMQVGTFKYGQLGGSMTTTGTGSPVVVGGYGGPGGMNDTAALLPVGSLSLGVGSWFVTSRLSFQAGASTPIVTCQLKLSSAKDQGRVILDTGNDLYNFAEMSLTKTVSAASNASVACNESAGSLGAGFFDLKVFAIKAGSLTDTDID
jgi:hypothetical protein